MTCTDHLQRRLDVGAGVGLGEWAAETKTAAARNIIRGRRLTLQQRTLSWPDFRLRDSGK